MSGPRLSRPREGGGLHRSRQAAAPLSRTLRDRAGEGLFPPKTPFAKTALPLLCTLLVCSAALHGCIPQSRAAQNVPEQDVSRSGPTLVSLNPCSDAILAQVADPAQILAISHYSKDARSSSMDPALASRLPSTRGTIEEVLALRPDVVIGSTFIDPASASAYHRLGLRLETVGMASTIADSHAQIRQIAALAGHPERGEALIARIDAVLAATAAPPGTPPVAAVVWQSGGMVPGDQTLIADLLRHTGFANFAAARGFGQADLLSLEKMLADPPAVIFVAGQTGETGQSSVAGGDDRVLSHPALDALKHTHRVTLDPKLLFCGGPTIAAAAQRLSQIRRFLPEPGKGTSGMVVEWHSPSATVTRRSVR